MKTGVRFPKGYNTDYPLVPLTDEEKMPLQDGGGAALSRFKHRMESAQLFDYIPALQRIAETVYFKGGKLSRFGIRPKENIDESLAFEVLSAMFRSPFPNHIQKEATIALALYNWYEDGSRDTSIEPTFPVFFRRPGQQEVGTEVLTGKNRN